MEREIAFSDALYPSENGKVPLTPYNLAGSEGSSS
jgi:hypothetical protein